LYALQINARTCLLSSQQTPANHSPAKGLFLLFRCRKRKREGSAPHGEIIGLPARKGAPLLYAIICASFAFIMHKSISKAEPNGFGSALFERFSRKNYVCHNNFSPQIIVKLLLVLN